METAIQYGHAYGKTLVPKRSGTIGNDELHAAAADVHDEYRFIALDGYGPTDATINEPSFFLAADEGDGNAGAPKRLLHKFGSIGGSAQCSGSECLYGFRTMRCDAFLEGRQRKQSALKRFGDDEINAADTELGIHLLPKYLTKRDVIGPLHNKQVESVGSQINDGDSVHQKSVVLLLRSTLQTAQNIGIKCHALLIHSVGKSRLALLIKYQIAAVVAQVQVGFEQCLTFGLVKDMAIGSIGGVVNSLHFRNMLNRGRDGAALVLAHAELRLIHDDVNVIALGHQGAQDFNGQSGECRCGRLDSSGCGGCVFFGAGLRLTGRKQQGKEEKYGQKFHKRLIIIEILESQFKKYSRRKETK